MGLKNEMKSVAAESMASAATAADSPTSVLEDEAKLESGPRADENDQLLDDAKNGDSSLISKAMAEEEKKLQLAREKEDSERETNDAAAFLMNNSHFSKLDELLTQTQLYSEFLMEKMEDITFNGMENQKEEIEKEKKGRGKKRKAKAQYNNIQQEKDSRFSLSQAALSACLLDFVWLEAHETEKVSLLLYFWFQRKAKTAVAAMLTRIQEGATAEDAHLTEEEKAEKEQAELIPLLTGGKLKPYQIKGVKWLISLWQNGLNGILADQMGLGKTVQTIGFLAHLKGKGLDGPYLIVAPLSTLSNWVNEVKRFAPSTNVVIYHGTRKERQEIRQKSMPREVDPKFPLVITSYEIAMNDSRVLANYKWKYLVVDEGHRLKNTHCKLLRELKRLPIENKLLLTGTPLQNNLAELWSLLNFILPDIFSSHEEFESWFDLSGKCPSDAQEEEVEEKRRVQVISKLHLILRPFLLRRLKEDVEQMLPRKKEIILYANMTDHQKHFQDHLINKTLGKYLLDQGSWSGMRVMTKSLNNVVMQLRKNCNHPDLLESAFNGSFQYPPVEQLLEQCGKFRLLDRLLELLLAQKHKVLIFSQMTKVLNIIDYYLSEKGHDVCRIDGGVKLGERKRQIEEFNDTNSNVRIFLLSTRAGGLGINLTAADTCILYDSDWNPQMDLQAMDRCHRIGQTRPVHVYRLATSLSVEGRMLKKAFGKLKLEHLVIGKGQFKQESVKPNTLDELDLLALLRDEEDAEDKLIQTDISDEDLARVLDRNDLVVDSNGAATAVDPPPLKGPGWEVVSHAKSDGSMLSAVAS